MPEPIEGLILSSTTDTQEQVDYAAGIKVVEAPEVEETETDAVTETADTETQKPRGRGGFQRKIDKLTKRVIETESRAEAAERRAKELEAQLAKPADAATKTEPVKTDTRPKLADYQTPEEWAEALTDWKLEQRDTKQRQEAEEAERREVFDTYQTRRDEAKAKHSDWDEVMEEVESGKVTVPPAAYNAIIESEIGPEIAYYLATHEEAREKIQGMTSAISIAREIGKIEAALTPKTTESPKPIRSNAPKPITPVGSSAKSTVSIDDPNISTEAYYETRKAMRRGR
jgi:hypothetical protein